MEDDAPENTAPAGAKGIIVIHVHEAVMVRLLRQQDFDVGLFRTHYSDDVLNGSAGESAVSATAAAPESGASASAAVPPDAPPPASPSP